MPFLRSRDIPDSVRLPPLEAQKALLRQRLPLAASEGERKHLLALLDKLTGTQSYQADSPPPIGAIDLPTLH